MITYAVDSKSNEVVVKVDNESAELFINPVIQIKEGLVGSEGRSAYVLAVRNGYVGTEAQWLASLKGQPGDSVIEDPGEIFSITLLNAMI